MLGLATEIGGEDLAVLAPQAVGLEWYPHRFLEPIEVNEPWLSSALALLGRVLEGLEEKGVGAGRVMVVGFSQGACLALEYAVRSPVRYGGVAALSGGLIGPPDSPRDYPGSLDGAPVFLGCGDDDPHIPVWRVRESEEVCRRMGADVEARVYRGMGHTVNADELDVLRGMARRLGSEA